MMIYLIEWLEKYQHGAKKDILISPCDGKLLAYKITDDLAIKIKNSYYSINTLIWQSKK